MKKNLLGIVAALGVWGIWFPGTCRAQSFYLTPPPVPIGRPLAGPYYNPYYGPYRGIGPGGVNYGLARPGFETTPATLQLQQLLAGASIPVAQEQAGGLPVTGHPASYFYYSHYYYNQMVGGGVGFGSSSPTYSGTGLLTSTPRTTSSAGSTGTNAPAGQPPKPTK